MAKEYLDKDGLTYFWGKIKAYVNDHAGGGGVTDVQVNGSSVVTSGVADVTVPTKISDLTNDRAYCYCIGVTSTTVSSASTNTKVPITAIETARDFTYDSTNKGVKCGKAGKYFVSAWLVTSTATAGDLMGVVVNKGSNSISTNPAYHRLNGSYDNIQMPPTYVQLAANDVLTMYVRNNTAGRGTVTECRFSIWEV